jgi:glutaminyl-peptide cyclotransferase
MKIRMQTILKFTLLALPVLAALPLGAGTPAFRKARAFDDLKKQCAFGPRVPGTRAHDACLAFLTVELKKSSAAVRLQTFAARDAFSGKTLSLTNMIASFGTSKKDRLLFCAHWDSRPVADFDPGLANRNRPVPGANDGASGAAVLLEIARAMKSSPPPVGVDLALFDGEDGGRQGDNSTWCVGSRYFAANRPKSSGWKYAVLIDMIGDKDLHLPVEQYSRAYAPEVVNRVWGAAAKLGLPAFSPQDGYEVIDDHLELIQAGIPAVDIIDIDYPYWHTVQDTPDKCSPESLETVGALLLHLIYDR